MRYVGLDVGTNLLVAATMGEEHQILYKAQRDAFYRLEPMSDINKNSIKSSLDKRHLNYLVDDGDFIIVGEDALDIAIERNGTVQRPLKKGVLSPKEKNALPMLKRIIEDLVSTGDGTDKLVYSVPASPVDASFDIEYHTQMMNKYISEMGYNPSPVNEAFAIGLAELIDDDLTGITMSFGAGMVNVAILHYGEPVVSFSMTRAGDYVDNAVATALDLPVSLVQKEKEEMGLNLLDTKPKDRVNEALCIYYESIINYAVEYMFHMFKPKFSVLDADRHNKPGYEIPVFRNPVPVIIAGGLTLAEGFAEKVKSKIEKSSINMFKIGDIRRASNPLYTVAKGCLLAAQL